MSLLTAMGMVSNQGTWKLEKGQGSERGRWRRVLGGGTTPSSALGTPLSKEVPTLVGKPATGGTHPRLGGGLTEHRRLAAPGASPWPGGPGPRCPAAPRWPGTRAGAAPTPRRRSSASRSWRGRGEGLASLAWWDRDRSKPCIQQWRLLWWQRPCFKATKQ